MCLSSTCRAQLKQSDLPERLNLRIGPANKIALLQRGYGIHVLPEASTGTRSRVEYPSYRLQHFSSCPSSLRFHRSDGNSQNASCFAD